VTSPAVRDANADEAARVTAACDRLAVALRGQPWLAGVGHAKVPTGQWAVLLRLRWFDPIVAGIVANACTQTKADVPLAVQIVYAPEGAATPLLACDQWRTIGTSPDGSMILRNDATGDSIAVRMPSPAMQTGGNNGALAQSVAALSEDGSMFSEAFLFFLGAICAYYSWTSLHNMARLPRQG
jgi:hypothetical protein